MAKWYTLFTAREVIKSELGIKDIATIKKFINVKGSPSLRAVVTGNGEGKRYRIKDEWLMKFIVDYENR